MAGPVQVLVVGFERPVLSGEVMAELSRLEAAGTVRLLDVLLLQRTGDGSFETVPVPDGPLSGRGRLAAEVLGRADPGEAAELPDDSAWSLADVIRPGGTAAVALIEHLWATPLRDAMQRSGGTALEETWLAREDVDLLAGLMEQGKA